MEKLIIAIKKRKAWMKNQTSFFNCRLVIFSAPLKDCQTLSILNIKIRFRRHLSTSHLVRPISSFHNENVSSICLAGSSYTQQS